MTRWVAAAVILLTVGLGGEAWAEQRDRHHGVRIAQSGEPGGQTAGEPGSQSGEPGGQRDGEPGAKPVAGEPQGKDEAVPAATTPVAKPQVLYGAGVHLRGIFVPSWFLNAFLASSTSLNSMALGGEFVRRKENFDIVASMNFGFYSPADGNYMGKGKNPVEDVDYIQFRNLNVLAFDVAFIWHHHFLKWLSLVYGAGLGFGIVLGDIYRISNTGCTPENLSNTNQCHPRDSNDPESDTKWRDNREKWLAEHTGGSRPAPDSPGDPFLWREEGKWPVVPIVHLLLGVNFKITDQINIRVDGGFHNAFYVGAAGHYFF